MRIEYKDGNANRLDFGPCPKKNAIPLCVRVYVYVYLCVCLCVCELAVDSEGEGGSNDDFYGNQNHIQRLLKRQGVRITLHAHIYTHTHCVFAYVCT